MSSIECMHAKALGVSCQLFYALLGADMVWAQVENRKMYCARRTLIFALQRKDKLQSLRLPLSLLGNVRPDSLLRNCQKIHDAACSFCQGDERGDPATFGEAKYQDPMRRWLHGRGWPFEPCFSILPDSHPLSRLYSTTKKDKIIL